MNEELNDKLTRCPRLGQEIKFSYCLQEAGDLPCARTIQCWQPVLEIENFLKEKLTVEQWQKFITARPQDKVISLIEIIAAAKAKKPRV
jgi:hypothetical protein